jgi:hypothetical protein
MLGLLVDSQPRGNHNRAEITRFLFGQPLSMAAVGSRWLVSTAAIWGIPKDAISSTNFIGGTPDPTKLQLLTVMSAAGES